ncbi:MAG: glutaminyl-tRNA synthase (glutamine-hydrolyzing) subunit A [Candidatus Taylorbacteria bacterium RIFOXYD2_FULL_36_9]|uniref:Glutamyl-tRNA(Gln) amidotransferase subunit A n=1 Tax=Candidatus Taylorbacteria bacterium RIFOXYD2_FULL_36_9 TaxID=1802338 RepID=A0A1G2PGP8_9BACT|nr:MAG: glutaminyl-tRNA synthase (glutamine-hydrolyzing) subunit A [Candidatus Taylorbacteria bacterium RIFOXYD2_FULL_36_9]
MIDLTKLTIRKAHEALIKGEYTAVELAQAYLDNIKKKDSEIHAYLEVFADVLDQAKEADKRIKSEPARLHSGGENITLMTGIPVAVKDNILIKGRIASSASKILENYTATYDATVIKKLKEAGAVFLGRTNMDEFAMGGSTENSAYGVTKNPYDLERVSGGSSGGSAAVVSADLALVALGSDTGGSIRQPASFCGIVGLKPTYGAVSRSGLMAMGSSFDQIGPLGKTVEDAKILFDFISGKDELDSTSICRGETLNQKKGFSSAMIKIGIPKEVMRTEGLDPEVLKSFTNTVEKLKKQGYEILEISLPNLKYSLAVYYTLIPAEVSSNMARFDGVKYGLHTDGINMVDDYFKTREVGFGPEVKRRIILGTYILSSGYYDAYYNKANIVRNLIREDYKKAFEQVDVIITPTTPGPAFKIGEKINDPLQLYLEDIFTVPANLVGLPAISIPCGFKDIEGKKLPLGIQFLTSAGNEKTLFEIAKEIEIR